MTRTGEYLGKLFAHMGKECYIEPPFYCDYGTNIHVGDYFYANTGLIVLDQCDVIIGDHAFLGQYILCMSSDRCDDQKYWCGAWQADYNRR